MSLKELFLISRHLQKGELRLKPEERRTLFQALDEGQAGWLSDSVLAVAQEMAEHASKVGYMQHLYSFYPRKSLSAVLRKLIGACQQASGSSLEQLESVRAALSKRNSEHHLKPSEIKMLYAAFESHEQGAKLAEKTMQRAKEVERTLKVIGTELKSALDKLRSAYVEAFDRG